MEIPTKSVKIQRHRCSLLMRLTWILHRQKLSSFWFEHDIYILLIRPCSIGGVNNVKFLRIDWMKDKEEADLILEFQNLTHLELGYSDYTRDWVEGLEVIKRCPNLQILDIDMGSIDMNARGDEGADWSFP
ncbi:hypothetical protein JHK84_055562 [Glycine max]|nr:hypothetical protein JHK86_055521 [Glycine max]KAG4918253.1 hypothetical protein JHK85_056534 [Glycine max]KAG5074331.1 hypothetical protein JHK84_055562 [Glycine max]